MNAWVDEDVNDDWLADVGNGWAWVICGFAVLFLGFVGWISGAGT